MLFLYLVVIVQTEIIYFNISPRLQLLRLASLEKEEKKAFHRNVQQEQILEPLMKIKLNLMTFNSNNENLFLIANTTYIIKQKITEDI